MYLDERLCVPEQLVREVVQAHHHESGHPSAPMLLADMKLPWAYIHKGKAGPSLVRRLTGKDRIEWADGAGKQAVITALVKRQEKARA